MLYKTAKKEEANPKWSDTVAKTLEKEKGRQYTGRELTGDSKIPSVVYMAVADRQRKGHTGDLLGFKNKKELQDWASGIARSGARAKADLRKEKSLEELDEALLLASTATAPTRLARSAFDAGKFVYDTAQTASKAKDKITDTLVDNKNLISAARAKNEKDGKRDASLLDKVNLGYTGAKIITKGIAKDKDTMDRVYKGTVTGLDKPVAKQMYRRITNLAKQAPLPRGVNAALTFADQTNKLVSKATGKADKKKLQQPETFDQQGIKDYLGGNKNTSSLSRNIALEGAKQIKHDIKHNVPSVRRNIRALDSISQTAAKMRNKESSVYYRFYKLGCIAAENSIRQ